MFFNLRRGSLLEKKREKCGPAEGQTCDNAEAPGVTGDGFVAVSSVDINEIFSQAHGNYLGIMEKELLRSEE